MLKITGSEDFYPTPESLLSQITTGLDWEEVRYVLEPSAGRGKHLRLHQAREGAYSGQLARICRRGDRLRGDRA